MMNLKNIYQGSSSLALGMGMEKKKVMGAAKNYRGFVGGLLYGGFSRSLIP